MSFSCDQLQLDASAIRTRGRSALTPSSRETVRLFRKADGGRCQHQPGRGVSSRLPFNAA
jgi:hypothetical protein